MRKQELESLQIGSTVENKKTGEILNVVEIGAKVTLSNDKQYSESTLIRWWSVVEPVDLVEPQDTQGNNEDDQLHDQHDTTVKTDVVEGNTGTTSNKITKDDIIYIIEHSNCDAVVKKQYIGAYREDYKGAVVMVRTTKKGNTHIDMKQGIFNSLAESTRNRLEANYNAKVYDQSRGYIRLFEVDDLRVLQDLILTALKIA